MATSRVRGVSPRFEITEMEYFENSSSVSSRYHRILQIVIDFSSIVIVLITFGIVYVALDPKVAYFYCNDTDLFYPYIPETVPFWAVGIFGIGGPLLIIIAIEIFNLNMNNYCVKANRKPKKTFLIHLFHGISLFLLGMSITMLLTEVSKRWTGRLRPHFMAVCEPVYNCTTDQLIDVKAIFTGDGFCTGNEQKIKEARFSFPSGHASFSCYTMLYAIIYIEIRLSLLCFRHLKTLLQMTCFLAAIVTSLSRVSDYHHRGSDVLGGAILGLTIALFITIFSGRVLFAYNPVHQQLDIDLPANKGKN